MACCPPLLLLLLSTPIPLLLLCGAVVRFRRRSQTQMHSVTTLAAISATPPMTPPTMAPTGTDFGAAGAARAPRVAVAALTVVALSDERWLGVALAAASVRCSSIQRRVGNARHAKPLTPADGSMKLAQ
jgi:hypothetical protein